jgi:hypothetical protein
MVPFGQETLDASLCMADFSSQIPIRELLWLTRSYASSWTLLHRSTGSKRLFKPKKPHRPCQYPPSAQIRYRPLIGKLSDFFRITKTKSDAQGVFFVLLVSL